jgi:paraquat-inducible protein B
MSKRAIPTVIGAFVIGAVILAVATVRLLSSGGLFVEKPRFVLYFKGSV